MMHLTNPLPYSDEDQMTALLGAVRRLYTCDNHYVKVQIVISSGLQMYYTYENILY